MSRLLRILIALCLPTLAAAQTGVRYDNYNMTSSNAVPFGAQAPIYTLPNSTVTVCAYPDDGGQPCGNVIPIYSDPALTQTADNPITADVHGRFGFWLAPGTYTYSVVTQGGVFVGTYIFTLGGSGGGSGCATGGTLSPNGQLIYNDSGDCASSPNIVVVPVTNSQTPASATQGVVINSVTDAMGDDHVNLQLNSAVDPSSNYSFFAPHLWKMQCSNSGTSLLGCSLNLFDDDNDATPTTGGLQPIWIKMFATQPGNHPSYAGITIDETLAGGTTTTAGMEGIQINGPDDPGGSHVDHVTAFVANMKAGTEFLNYETPFRVTTPGTVTPPSGYCDFWGGNQAGTQLRETFGCGPTKASTFFGPVIAPTYQETLTTPASSSATCTAGQFTDDANFHYVCTATNTWRRVALTSF